MFSKRLAHFEQNLSEGSLFTMSQSFSLKPRFVLESTFRKYSLRSLDSNYAVCVSYVRIFQINETSNNCLG